MDKNGKFLLCTRDEFKDWILEQKIDRKIELIQNHHTYIPSYAHFKGSNHFELCKGMESSHISRGFDEIAQNITTFPDGKIMICRDLDKTPAGIKGANSNGICIEHVGNFDVGGDVMTEEHKKTIIFLNAIFCKKFNLTPNENSIVYHHWYDLETGKKLADDEKGTRKSCCGTNWFSGNTIAIAKKYFIPLVTNELNNMNKPKVQEVKVMSKSNEQLMGESAVKDLVKKGFINSPDTWLEKELDKETVPLWLFFVMLDRLSNKQ